MLWTKFFVSNKNYFVQDNNNFVQPNGQGINLSQSSYKGQARNVTMSLISLSLEPKIASREVVTIRDEIPVPPLPAYLKILLNHPRL